MALALVGDMHGGGPKQPSALKEAQPQAIQLQNVRGNVRTWQREKVRRRPEVTKRLKVA